MTTPVAIYLRSSTARTGLERQRSEVRAYAKKHGLKIVCEYVDDGISGAAGSNRPEFQKIIADAQNGDIGAIVAYDLSRFGRMDPDETGYFRFLLRKAGVRIFLTNEDGGGDDDTGEILCPVLAVKNREVLKQLSRDVLRGQAQAFKRGVAKKPARREIES